MNQLPEITNFDEALTSIGQFNLLQAELNTLAQPMTDLELMITHVDKYSTSPHHSEQFIPLRLKYSRTQTIILLTFPHLFWLRSQLLPPSFTWSQYSQDVAQCARAHNSVPRTSTALSVTAPSPDRTYADCRVQKSNRWDKSSSPDLAYKGNRREGGFRGGNAESGQFRERSRSKERDCSRDPSRYRERSQERNSRRSGFRDRSEASLTDGRSKSSSSNR